MKLFLGFFLFFSGIGFALSDEIPVEACNHDENSANALKGNFLAQSGVAGEFCDSASHSDSQADGSVLQNNPELNNLKAFLDSSKNPVAKTVH